MIPTVPGLSAPDGGFEVPLEMLAACHGRIEHQCETLRRLVAHLPLHGADGQARDAARALMRYFDGAAVHHHQDEEHDLFPALLASMAGSDAVCLHELTAALGAEHRAHWPGHARAPRPDGLKAPAARGRNATTPNSSLHYAHIMQIIPISLRVPKDHAQVATCRIHPPIPACASAGSLPPPSAWPCLP